MKKASVGLVIFISCSLQAQQTTVNTAFDTLPEVHITSGIVRGVTTGDVSVF
jgi:hypothetical protein